MTITIRELLAQLPAGVEKQVTRARDDARRLVQDAIRDECKLLMRTPEEVRRGCAGAQVPIEVVPGYPDVLKSLELPDDYWRILLLSRYRWELEACQDGVTELISLRHDLIDKIESKDAADGLLKDLRANGRWVSARLAEIREVDPVQQIVGYNEDVLGAYRYWTGNGDDDEEPNRAKIELYWGGIGLVPSQLPCRVEDLTVVVLAHELAHGYSEVGADITGRRWLASSFAEAETGLQEGIAQHLCRRALLQVERRYLDAIAVFERLADHQPPPYQVHRSWQDTRSPEAIRAAMLEVRRNRLGRLTDFDARLERAADVLG